MKEQGQNQDDGRSIEGECSAGPGTDGAELMEAHLESDLSPEEHLRLEQWLTAHPDNLREFILRAHLHHCLRQEGRSVLAVSGAKDQSAARVIRFPRGIALLAVAALITIVGTILILNLKTPQSWPVIQEVAGAAAIQREGKSLPATVGFKLFPGDRLQTFSASVGIVFSRESTTMGLDPQTDMRIDSIAPGKNFYLAAGKVKASVAPQRLFFPMRIQTPLAEAQVLGTKLALMVHTNRTELDVFQGKVRFTRKADRVQLDIPANSFAIAAADYEFAALPQTGQILW
jgi:ferric-dicitrate binding protein FerR (iron transport regulator)